jgi:hypothetical protein
MAYEYLRSASADMIVPIAAIFGSNWHNMAVAPTLHES